MKTRKILALMLVAVMALAMLAGCTSAPAPAPSQSANPQQPTPSTPGQPTPSAPAQPKDLMDMTWDEIYEEAKKEGEVIFFIWHDEAAFTEIGKAFEAKYPGVKFKLTVSDSSAAIDKAIAEKNGEKGSFDVYTIGGSAIKTLMDASALYDANVAKKMENYDKLDQGLCYAQEGVIHDGRAVPLYRNQSGLLYNPRNISNPPETWAELEAYIDANPLKFGFCHPLQGGSGGCFILAVHDNLCGGLEKYMGDTEADPNDMANWDIMWNWFRDRKSKITITTSNNDSLSRLNQGELDLVVAWDDGTFSAKANGELFKDATFYVPEFGLPGGGDTVGMLANAPHKAASLLLMNFLTGTEAQTMINSVLNSYPARTDIPVNNTVVPSEDFANRTEWTPAAYKVAYCKGFVAEVLQK